MGLPDPLIDLLRAHRKHQEEERAAACDLWEDTGYVFTTPTWSSTAMAARHQHVVAAVRRDVAIQVGGLLWRPPGAGEGPPPAA
jgi:hypothetical protein